MRVCERTFVHVRECVCACASARLRVWDSAFARVRAYVCACERVRLACVSLRLRVWERAFGVCEHTFARVRERAFGVCARTFAHVFACLRSCACICTHVHASNTGVCARLQCGLCVYACVCECTCVHEWYVCMRVHFRACVGTRARVRVCFY